MYDNGKTLYTGNKIAQDLEQIHHNLIATAGTRALNRAILAFVGTAEVSFNELSSTDAARNASLLPLQMTHMRYLRLVVSVWMGERCAYVERMQMLHQNQREMVIISKVGICVSNATSRINPRRINNHEIHPHFH